MRFNIFQKDPFKILFSTKFFVENARDVKINQEGLDLISQKIEERLKRGINKNEIGIGFTKDYQDEVQLVFLQDVVNFCFWSEKDKPLWRVKSIRGDFPSGGWFSLVNCFQKALTNKIPILKADYLISLTLVEVKKIFKGINGVDIPLAERRLENLHEAGRVLKNKYSGKFLNLLNEADFDAIKLVRLVYEKLPSFRDIAHWHGRDVFFLKRAQILAQDLSYLTQKYKNKKIKNLQVLTAFADYKLPQMLRKFAVIEYTDELAGQIDNYRLIPSGDRKEIEMRSATIWSIELIRQKLQKYSAADIDNALWLISQNQAEVKPHHRTYTIFY